MAKVTPANEAIAESWQLSLHQKSPDTIALYRRCLRYFWEWLTHPDIQRPRGTPGDLLAVGRQDIEAWIGAMSDNGLSRNTSHARWVALKSFYNWAHEEDEIDRNPMERVKLAKPDEPPPIVPPADDLARLLKTCDGKHFNQRRDLAIIRFMATTGARLTETASLQLPDIDLAARIAVIQRGKGGRPRVVRFDPKTTAALDRYLRARARHRHASEPWVWLGKRGHLLASGIYQMIERRGAQAGLDIHPHLLRHFWGDKTKRSGMSDEAVMKLGGWSSEKVMRRYGEALAVERALVAYDDHNPMDGV